MRYFATSGLTLVLLLLCVSAEAGPATAGTAINVTTTDNEDNVDGDCSLLEALIAAETNSARDACPAGGADDTIVIPTGVYPATGFGINSPMSLVGSGMGTVLDGQGTSRVLTINSQSAIVSITDLTIRNGKSAYAGLIENNGTLSLERVTLQNGEATLTAGGAIGAGLGSITTIINSTIEDNVARGGSGGGGIFNAGNLTIADSLIRDNGDAAEGAAGGGIMNDDEGALTIIRSLIANNTTDLVDNSFLDFRGGGILNEGAASLENVTVTGNSAGAGGAIFNVGGGTMSLVNVTIADNSIGDPGNGPESIGGETSAVTAINTIVSSPSESGVTFGTAGLTGCSGEVTSAGHNLETGSSCGFSGDGDQQNTNPVLGALADNGGPSETHALLQGSPAIDAGDDAACPAEDQRSVARPQGAACDIGAYEAGGDEPSPSPTPVTTLTPTESPSPTASPSPTGPPTPTPVTEDAIWGDNNCSGAADPVDALLALRYDAGLSTNTGACPAMGTPLDVDVAVLRIWGDVDCLGSVTPVDGLKLLRFDAGLSVSQGTGCPLIGSNVILTEVPVAVQISVLADGDDEDGSFTNDEVVSPSSTVRYLVTVDNDSGVPTTVSSVLDDVYGAVTCIVEGGEHDGLSIIGLALTADDGDGASLNGGTDELQCIFEETAPSGSGAVVLNTTTVTITNGAFDTDTAQITVN